MTTTLLYFGAGILAGALLAGLWALCLWRRWHKMALELEQRLRSHSFELQIALDELAEKNHLLEQQSVTDTLSGAYNRAFFDQRMRAELKRSRREQRPLALILLDLDHFKKINDEYGHLAGDQAIKLTAALIRQQLKRPGDKLCRYGGEEFAIILPNTDLAGALNIAEHIRAELATTPLTVLQHQVTITLSAGCYAAIANADSDPDQFIAFADQALYRAKAAGRDQVHSYPQFAPPVITALGEKNDA